MEKGSLNWKTRGGDCGRRDGSGAEGKRHGGRNQELALSAARGLEGLPNAVLFSLGSDGTDGPTDAAGGIVDGNRWPTAAAGDRD